MGVLRRRGIVGTAVVSFSLEGAADGRPRKQYRTKNTLLNS